MTKYVLANVEVPIKISEDGTIDTLQSFAKIHIIKQIDSPEVLTSNPLPVQQQVKELFEKDDLENSNEEKIYILKEDIKPKIGKVLKNTSLKHRKSNFRNKTMRNY